MLDSVDCDEKKTGHLNDYVIRLQAENSMLCWFLWFTGTFHWRNGFYTVQAVCAIALHPTPKLSPHRRRCNYIFPQKNSLCMIYKRFKLWGH